MTQQTINVGTQPNDHSGDPLRIAFQKINSNFTDLYSAMDAVVQIPVQTGYSGKYLTTSGSALSWSNVSQLTNSTYSLTLGSDGTLNLPQAPSAGAAVIQPSNTTYGIKFVANGNIWTLGTNGSLTFPDTSVQTTAWTGILPSPTYSGSSSIGNVTPAPLNLNNTGSAGQIKTQLTLINTAGNGNTGSAIDFYTYTDQGNGVPGARLQSIDNNNYSANFSIALKGVGNAGNNTLTTKWTFGADASLTFPDTSVQTTAYTGWPVLNATGSSGPTAIVIGYNASAGVFGVSIGDGAGAGNQSGSSISSSSINIGYNAGNAGQQDHTIAIGSGAGNSSQGRIAIAIGYQAGATSQGNYAIAIGANAGVSNQPANTIILNATSSNLNGVSSQTSSFYVAPVRTDNSPSNVLFYNTTTNEVTYGSAPGAAAGTLTGTTLANNVVTFASTTATQTINFANGITANGNTNTVNIATAGASGSTTQVTIGSPSGTSGVNINGVTTHSAAVKFNGALQSGSGTTNITLTNNGPTMNGVTTMGIVATAQTAGNIVSAATIAPTNPITFVSGNTQITTITTPSGIATYGGQITLIPIGTWTTATGGNIALATIAVTNKALIMTYDAGTTKWYPSY